MFLSKLLTNGLRCNLAQLTSRSIYTIQSLVASKIQPQSSIIPTTPLQSLVQSSQLLKPVSFLYNQVAGFKVKGRLRRRCKDCFFVMRQQRLYIICKTHPRHKQMSMKPKEKNTWILTHATQSKIRPY